MFVSCDTNMIQFLIVFSLSLTYTFYKCIESIILIHLADAAKMIVGCNRADRTALSFRASSFQTVPIMLCSEKQGMHEQREEPLQDLLLCVRIFLFSSIGTLIR